MTNQHDDKRGGDQGGDQGGFGPEKLWPLVAAGFAVLLGWQYLAPQSPPSERVAVLRAGFPEGSLGQRVTERECKATPERIWVSSDEFTECIAYIVARPASPNASASDTGVIFFNGDVATERRGAEAQPEVRKGELIRAQALASRFGVTTIVMGRPGLMGSTGFHQTGGMREDAYIMSAAVDGVRDALGVRRLAMAGQSGGARLIAQLMALKRRDLVCAAMGSGAYDLPEKVDGSRARTNVFGNAQRRYLIPMLEAETIPVVQGQRLFVIGDPEDKIAKFPEQRAWFEKLKALGHTVALIEGKGGGPSRHGLADAAIAAAAACASGQSDGEIIALVKS